MLYKWNWPINKWLLAGVIALATLTGAPAFASGVPEVESRLNNPAPIGQARVRWLGISLYQASLFTPSGSPFDWSQPFALRLDYDQDIDGERLISTTIKEMRRMEGAREDHTDIATKLTACFRDVRDGDRYVALAQGRDRIGFWLNGTQVCDLRHDGIRERLLGIWLSENSRMPNLTRQLRGGQ